MFKQTLNSDSVCPTVRCIAVHLQDSLADADHARFSLLMQRAKGSATDDVETIEFRLDKLAHFTWTMAVLGPSAKAASNTAASEAAAEMARSAATCAAGLRPVSPRAAQLADSISDGAAAAVDPPPQPKLLNLEGIDHGQQVINACLVYLEDVLPAPSGT